MLSHANYERGVRAWESGNISEAISEWMAAADAEDGRAMLALGIAYRQGLGVLQDYVDAHKWFNLAASRGIGDAIKERDATTAEMNASERSEARTLARQLRPGGGTTVPAETAVDEEQVVAENPKPPPEAIQEAQALLAALGYRPGPADGLWGKRSIYTYRSFLRDDGLPASDVLTLTVLLAMRDIAAQQGVEQDAGAIFSSGSALPSDALHRAERRVMLPV